MTKYARIETKATTIHELGREKPMKSYPHGRVMAVRVDTFSGVMLPDAETDAMDWSARQKAGVIWTGYLNGELPAGPCWGYETQPLRDGERYQSGGSPTCFATEAARDKALEKYLKAAQKAADKRK